MLAEKRQSRQNDLGFRPSLRMGRSKPEWIHRVLLNLVKLIRTLRK